MNPLIMQLKINLAATEKEFKEQKIKALRCINELNSANPFFGDDIDLINAEELEQSADELLIVKKRLKELQQKIHDIKKELGENL